ncbi:oxygenase MpaB family protein [Luteipulveratus mongoliensis]|uniref:ER-bound oxygenase mpaB/mpaB'/Rubber oxygenase catalytic domain-containing protein n=1 Tax=Luteipulveratus mongoliensis TaxID=571913 RepID=A0A0K1JFD5_9MICO|nr:oxygenase MpaB family protein [Luteipulveratus mongoliensis]AKU15416.1 hypothetical protein VV02_05280 [Luteipulveratus mongoliensis]
MACPQAATSVPTRFRCDPQWGERVARPFRLLVGRDAGPSSEEIHELQDALVRRDELGAALARAIHHDKTVTMAQFRQALTTGLGSVPDPAPELTAFFERVESRPDWVDDELLLRAGAAIRRVGWDAGDILAYGSLLGGYQSAAALEPLARTGRLDGPETLRRVGETSAWWLACTEPGGGMARDSEGFRLSVHVRLMHAFVNDALERQDDWDWTHRGVPINQYDQASTIQTFSTTFLIHARLLGVRISRQDSKAIMHLWSYVGWLMGVDEQWLPRTERVGRRATYHLLSNDPPPDHNSRSLAAALIGMTDHYPDSTSWRRRFQRERALSLGTHLIRPSGMRDVGLPVRPPWYPAFRIASNLMWFQLIGRLPGGTDRLDRRAARALVRLDRLQFGGRRPRVGPASPNLTRP